MAVSQGLVIGPTLWNKFYIPVLEFDFRESCELMAYADNLDLLATVQNVCQIIHKIERDLGIVGQCIESYKLRLAPQKTEAVIFHRGHVRVNYTVFRQGQIEVTISRAVK